MPKKRKSYTPETHKHIAIDYDGTIVDDVSYPNVGTPNPGAIETIDAMLDKGYLINIWTCRGGAHESVDFIQEDAIRQQLDDLLTNELGKNIMINKHFKYFTDKYAVGSPKISADVYIDNNAYGLDKVDWSEIYEDFIGEKPIDRMEDK